jgi:hypothetical protein
MTDNSVPIQVKQFINYVLPEEYRPGHLSGKTNKRCRLLVDEELHKPIDLLNNTFFKIFH